MVYQDDLIICSFTFKEHLDHIRTVLTILKDTYNNEKCLFGQPEVKFVGHIVNHGGVKMDPGKTSGILQLDRPKSRKEILQFHGMANFYSSYVERFDERFEPMYRLLKKNAKFVWGDEQEKAFVDIKKR